MHSDAKDDQNIDFSSDEDVYRSDIHEELTIVKERFEGKKRSQGRKKLLSVFWERVT